MATKAGHCWVVFVGVIVRETLLGSLLASGCHYIGAPVGAQPGGY